MIRESSGPKASVTPIETNGLLQCRRRSIPQVPLPNSLRSRQRFNWLIRNESTLTNPSGPTSLNSPSRPASLIPVRSLLRSIMTHHSGLPSDHLREMIRRDPTSLTETERELRDEWVAYPPNFIFSYSNVALRLLGLLIERASHKDFDSHLKETLFLPLDMVNTSFVPEPHMNPLLSKGYRGGMGDRGDSPSSSSLSRRSDLQLRHRSGPFHPDDLCQRKGWGPSRS